MNAESMIHFIVSLEQFCTEQHRRMKEKGFWDAPPNHGEKLMLMVSELSEAFEAVRKGIADAPCDKLIEMTDRSSPGSTRRLTNMEEELSDTVIRIADYCGYKNIDLGRCILAKLAFNATRPHMHNRKC